MMAKAPAKPDAKKATPKTKSPLQKAVTAHLASGKALEKAKTKHTTTGAALKKLEEKK